ncbi:MAG: Abi family protein [Limnobacter sp.]|uniref:Abi family protein n=1 Tax=Limnobacter sp. TaxID=2003368 RepID=UPI00391B58BF
MYFCQSISVVEIEKFVSSARLSSYHTLIGSPKLEDAIGSYVWGLELNGALSSLLSVFEVVLRNSIHGAASAYYGKQDWYLDLLKWQGDLLWHQKVAQNLGITQKYYRSNCPPYNKKKITLGSVQKNLMHWRSPAEGKIEEIKQRLTKSGKPNTPNQIVAHAMFGFWLNLFEHTFESATDPSALWPTCLNLIFRNNPSVTRAQVEAALSGIKDLRNRISHHEPAWKIAVTQTPAGVHAALNIQVREIVMIIEAISGDVSKFLVNSGILERIARLTDPTVITAYAGNQQLEAVDLRKAVRRFKKIVRGSTKRNHLAAPQPEKSFSVTDGENTLVTVTPHI